MNVKNVPLWTSHQTCVLLPKYLPSHRVPALIPCFFYVITMNDTPSSIFFKVAFWQPKALLQNGHRVY